MTIMHSKEIEKLETSVLEARKEITELKEAAKKKHLAILSKAPTEVWHFPFSLVPPNPTSSLPGPSLVPPCPSLVSHLSHPPSSLVPHPSLVPRLHLSLPHPSSLVPLPRPCPSLILLLTSQVTFQEMADLQTSLDLTLGDMRNTGIFNSQMMHNVRSFREENALLKKEIENLKAVNSSLIDKPYKSAYDPKF
jgi:hypothetical protein